MHSEEDGIIEEALRGHQHEADKRSWPIGHKHGLDHVAERRVAARPEPRRFKIFRLGELNLTARNFALDLADDLFRFRLIAVDDEPARAFGNERAQSQDDQPEKRADEEGEPPTEIRREACLIEQ